MKNIEKGEFYRKVCPVEAPNKKPFVKKIKFDFKSNYVVCYGGTHIFLMNLATSQASIWPIDELLYEDIYDLVFDS